jgi:WD40 repeat protein
MRKLSLCFTDGYLPAGELLATLQLENSGFCVKMSPTDPTMVFVGGDGGLLLKWNTATGARTPLQGHKDRVCSLSMSEDGATVASGSTDGTVRLWDTATCLCLWVSETKNIPYRVLIRGDMVICCLNASDTIGLRKSDGSAALNFGRACLNPVDIAVAQSE